MVKPQQAPTHHAAAPHFPQRDGGRNQKGTSEKLPHRDRGSRAKTSKAKQRIQSPFPTTGSCLAKKQPSHFRKDKCCNSQSPPLSAPSFYFCPEAPQLGTSPCCPGCAPPQLLVHLQPAGWQAARAPHVLGSVGAVLHSVNLAV